MKETTILIVDDEPDMLRLLKRSIEPDLGCRVVTVSSGEEAISRIGDEDIDLVLADIKMPGMDGLELLDVIKHNIPDMTVVMMTGHGSIETAVASMKMGAYDFITKPFDYDALAVRLQKALERSSLLKENVRLRRVCRGEGVFENIVGESPAMQAVFDKIRMIANTDMTALITGESGTGKELTAHAIHSLSPRSAQPFVVVNCPTVPEQILESELFGYRKGAFTNAVGSKTGLFQEAHGGSIFLDEIGDISPAIQTKLLRVLQEKEIKPLGDNRTVKVDVRIIASTNQNLQQKIVNGEFREDFFYRLNVLPIELPSLRQRREDIPLLAAHLLEKQCREMDRPVKRLSAELLDRLKAYPWVGNIRELQNVLIQGILYSSGNEIGLEDLRLVGDEKRTYPSAALEENNYRTAKEKALQLFNDTYLGSLLHRNQGNVTQAARQCGLERQSLQQIMKRYSITAEDYRK